MLSRIILKIGKGSKKDGKRKMEKNVLGASLQKSENEEYLCKIFTMLKKMENISIIKEKTELNNTELRLITEVLFADLNGERLISTQIAKKLSVTRSAISQIVNNLEERGIIKRVPDKVDRKIAYIELTDSSFEVYQKAKNAGEDFIGELVKDFGKERLDLLLSLSEDFWETIAKLHKKETEDKE